MVPAVEGLSKSGNRKWNLKVLVDPCTGQPGTWWNLTIMDNLMEELKRIGAESVLEKFSYAKFVGVGKQSEYVGKDGSNRTSCDLLVNAIELQNKEFISVKRDRDEDAPRREPGDDDIPF